MVCKFNIDGSSFMNIKKNLMIVGGAIALLLTACTGGGSSSTGVAPTVKMLSPINTATNVSRSPSIQLQFNEVVTGINTSSVTLHKGSVSGTTVAIGNITTHANNIYSFNPSVQLATNTAYYVVLNAAIKNSSNTALVPTSFSFTTRVANFMVVGSGDINADGISEGAILKINGVTNESSSISSPVSEQLNSIAVSSYSGEFVAVGNNRTLLTSKDGESWNVESLPSEDFGDLTGVTYGQGKFVIVAKNGYILTSSDSINWIRTNPNILNSIIFNGVSYGNGKFIVVGNGLKTGVVGNGAIMTSTDGLTWDFGTVIANTGALNSVIYGDGKFVAVGNSMPFPGSPLQAYGIVTSSDGIIWETATAPFVLANFSGISYGNGEFVTTGFNPVTGEIGIVTSPNAVNWGKVNEAFPNRLYGVTYSDGKFIAVGDNTTVMISTDPGSNWENITTNSSGSYKAVTAY